MNRLPHGLSAQRSPLDAPAERRCPVCDSERVTEIAMTLTDGTPVHFLSCRDCESRVWREQSGTLSFERVLAKATRVR
jgi:formate dehydrogenase maturation protein FdhE